MFIGFRLLGGDTGSCAEVHVHQSLVEFIHQVGSLVLEKLLVPGARAHLLRGMTVLLSVDKSGVTIGLDVGSIL